LQFDAARGYGFVAADDGGEDVFLHASVFEGDPGVLAPGTKVRFQTMAGDRGRKAFAVQLADDEPDPQDRQALPRTSVGATPTSSAQPSGADDDMLCDVLSATEFRRELTELLLNTVPELTGQQILQARQGMLEFAKKHGWIDG
jgi:CspA family cold shock protein